MFLRCYASMTDTQLSQCHMTERILNFKWYNIDSQVDCHHVTYFFNFPIMGQNSSRGIGIEVLGLLFFFFFHVKMTSHM